MNYTGFHSEQTGVCQHSMSIIIWLPTWVSQIIPLWRWVNLFNTLPSLFTDRRMKTKWWRGLRVPPAPFLLQHLNPSPLAIKRKSSFLFSVWYAMSRVPHILHSLISLLWLHQWALNGGGGGGGICVWRAAAGMATGLELQCVSSCSVWECR